MSLAAMNWARQQKTGSATRKAVLMAVADYADEQGLAWPSQKRIADDTEMTDRTVRSALADLIEIGLIVRRSKRNQDGTRNTDRLQLVMTDDLRKEFPAGGNRKQLPPDEQPENDNQTTGKSRQNHRKTTAKPPEAVSAEPFIEPPDNHQKNRSEANASGAVTVAEPIFSDVDDCWINGKLNLQAGGMTAKEAGDFVGSLLKRGHKHAEIAAATRASAAAGTRDPIKYVNGVLRAAKADAPRTDRRRTSAATRFLDRMVDRHGSDRTHGAPRSGGTVIDHEGDGYTHRPLH